jgi:hypothetical protein
MKITIDNLLGRGGVDYTDALDPTVAPRLERKINAPAAFTCKLVGSSHEFEVPVAGARVAVLKSGGEFLFTGYLTQKPEFEFLGWANRDQCTNMSLLRRATNFCWIRRRCQIGRLL